VSSSHVVGTRIRGVGSVRDSIDVNGVLQSSHLIVVCYYLAEVIHDVIQSLGNKVVFPQDGVGDSLVFEGGLESLTCGGVSHHSKEFNSGGADEIFSFVGRVHGGWGSGHVVSQRYFPVVRNGSKSRGVSGRLFILYLSFIRSISSIISQIFPGYRRFSKRSPFSCCQVWREVAGLLRVLNIVDAC
jgi:hypothetical protein